LKYTVTLNRFDRLDGTVQIDDESNDDGDDDGDDNQIRNE